MKGVNVFLSLAVPDLVMAVKTVRVILNQKVYVHVF